MAPSPPPENSGGGGQPESEGDAVLLNSAGRVPADKVETTVSGSVSGSDLTISVNGVASQPITLPSSNESEIWDEINLDNFPNDWVINDRIRLLLKIEVNAGASDWNTTPTVLSLSTGNNQLTQMLEYNITNTDGQSTPILCTNTNEIATNKCIYMIAGSSRAVSAINSGYILTIDAFCINGGGNKTIKELISLTRNKDFIYKMYRLRK